MQQKSTVQVAHTPWTFSWLRIMDANISGAAALEAIFDPVRVGHNFRM